MRKYLPYILVIALLAASITLPSVASPLLRENRLRAKNLFPLGQEQPPGIVETEADTETGEPGPVPEPEPETEPETEAKPESQPATKPAGASQRHVLGYYTVDYAGDVCSYNSLKACGSHIDSVAAFTFRVDSRGNIAGTAPRDGLKLAQDKGITALALIHNYRDGAFSAADVHNLLVSRENRQRLVKNMIGVLERDGYQGVNIDLEGVPYYDRRYYTVLVREFKEALQPLGYLTVVSIPAKTWDAPTDSWSGAFDYAAIGKYADWVQIMTYDEHWSGGPPGPVASLPWVEQVIKYAVGLIPRDKILLGTATYGYDWSSYGSSAVTSRNISSLLSTYGASPQWSDRHSVPYFYYYCYGVRHEVWYENAESARLKFNLVNKYNLKGIGIWNLGAEESAFWQAVAEKLP